MFTWLKWEFYKVIWGLICKAVHWNIKQLLNLITVKTQWTGMWNGWFEEFSHIATKLNRPCGPQWLAIKTGKKIITIELICEDSNIKLWRIPLVTENIHIYIWIFFFLQYYFFHTTKLPNHKSSWTVLDPKLGLNFSLPTNFWLSFPKVNSRPNTRKRKLLTLKPCSARNLHL